MTYNNLENRYYWVEACHTKTSWQAKKLAKLHGSEEVLRGTHHVHWWICRFGPFQRRHPQLYRVVCFTLVSISPSNWVNALQTSKNLRGESKSLHCFCYFCWGCSCSCHWFKDYYSSPHEAHLTCHLKTVKSPCWECGEFGWNLLTSEGGISKSNSRGLPPTKTRASLLTPTGTCFFFCENDVKVCQDANCTKWITCGWMRSSLRIQYDE